MPGRKVVLLSIDPWKADFVGFRPFNYSVRRLQAALMVQRDLDVEVEVLDFRTDDADEIIAEIEKHDPDLLGASSYVWSLPTFYEVARRLKASHPDLCIVFGGPSARRSMLSLAPYRDGTSFIDALAVGDGEDTLCEIAALPAWNRQSLLGVPGLEVATPTGWRHTGERPKPDDLDRFSSPFQMGLAPKAVSAHLETFRGCPFSCAFCEWGVLGTVSPVFSRDYLVRELKAFAAADAVGVFLVDAGLNLNAKAFRNLKAAEEETGVLRDKLFNCEFYPSHATGEHIEFLSSLKLAEVGVGLQSYDPQVLKRLNRPFNPEKFGPVIDAVSRVSNVTIELIIGLPGDNPTSFRATLERAMQHECAILISHCLVLPDALMTRGDADFDLDYDPLTLKMRSCLGWSVDDLAREWDHLGEMAAKLGGAVTAGALCRFPGAEGKGQGAGPQRTRVQAARQVTAPTTPPAALPDTRLVQLQRRPGSLGGLPVHPPPAAPAAHAAGAPPLPPLPVAHGGLSGLAPHVVHCIQAMSGTLPANQCVPLQGPQLQSVQPCAPTN